MHVGRSVTPTAITVDVTALGEEMNMTDVFKVGIHQPISPVPTPPVPTSPAPTSPVPTTYVPTSTLESNDANPTPDGNEAISKSTATHVGLAAYIVLSYAIYTLFFI